MNPINQHELPPSAIDVEVLAETMAQYHRIYAEDTQFLSHHPARRDEYLAELQAHPERRPSVWPKEINGVGRPPHEYDEYLKEADDAIAKLTPPETIEDRVARASIAVTALAVFTHKIMEATSGDDDLSLQILSLAAEKAGNDISQMLANDPSRQLLAFTSPGRTQPTRENAPFPSPAHPSGEAKAISPDEVSHFLASPHTMLGKRFLCTPPPDEDQENKGEWEVESYKTEVIDGEIDCEFVVLLESMDGSSLPMGADEVELMLQHSKIIGGTDV